MPTVNVSDSTVTITPPGGSTTITVPGGAQGPAGNAEKSGAIMVSGAESGSAALTTGNSKAIFRVAPEMNGMNLTAVGASVSTVSSSGAVSIMFRRVRGGDNADMLSTALTIDENERDSSNAVTAAVIDTGNDDVVTADQIHIDVDSAGTGVLGLSVTFTFETP